MHSLDSEMIHTVNATHHQSPLIHSLEARKRLLQRGTLSALDTLLVGWQYVVQTFTPDDLSLNVTQHYIYKRNVHTLSLCCSQDEGASS